MNSRVRRISIMIVRGLAAASLSISMFFVSTGYAASLSTYRIYLDEQKRETAFVIFNKSTVLENCSLGFRHNNFDDLGNMIRVEDGVIPSNSAQPWIRFSPRVFEIPPGVAQTVRFTLRRKANAQDGEYRSYLLIDCVALESQKSDERPQVSVQPRLVHNVPIIVRHGDLEAELRLENIIVDDRRVKFDLIRKGNRSTYGELQLFNTKTNEIVTFTRNVSIYPEFERSEQMLTHKGVPLEDLELRYIEDERYGGSVVLKKALSAK